jgi:hypothetical protein
MRKLRSYGFLVEETKFADSKAVVARVLVREGDNEHPVNPRSEGEDSIWDAPKSADGLAFDKLQVIVWAGKDYLAGPYVRYEDSHFVDTRLAGRMLKTLKKIDKQIAKTSAREAGDVVMAVAKAIGATWSVSPRSGDVPVSWYQDSKWLFDDVTEARDTMRRMVEAIRPPVAGSAA